MLLQGLGTPGWTWAPYRSLGRDRRCLVPDLRGCGRSPHPEGRYALRGMADDVARTLDAAGVGQVDVVGNSLGGAVAQALAVHHPDRVRRVVLIATTCGHDAARDALFAEVAEAAAQGRRARAGRLFAPWLVGPRVADVAGPLVAAGGAAVAAVGLPRPSAALAGQLAAMLDLPFDFCARLPEVTAPVLLIGGGRDRLAPPDQVADVAALLPRARHVELPRSGHLVVLRTRSVLRLVREFLDA